MTPVPNYIIDDLAYPLTPLYIKELDTCSRNSEAVYNNFLCSARNTVECAFGRLKNRSSMLTRKMYLELDNFSTVIYACFVLHIFFLSIITHMLMRIWLSYKLKLLIGIMEGLTVLLTLFTTAIFLKWK